MWISAGASALMRFAALEVWDVKEQRCTLTDPEFHVELPQGLSAKGHEERLSAAARERWTHSGEREIYHILIFITRPN